MYVHMFVLCAYRNSTPIQYIFLGTWQPANMAIEYFWELLEIDWITIFSSKK